jgi:pSer/pThr/pTyr-binding forkhead associated (FHA) protein
MPVQLSVKSKASASGAAQGDLLLDEDQIVIGRDQSCSVVLSDSVVSRRHACIVREGPLYFLEDLNSSYGTRVNGAALPSGEKRLLRNGDVIAVGPYDVVFDRVADLPSEDGDNAVVAKKVVKDALRGMSAETHPYLRHMNGASEGQRIAIRDAGQLVIGRGPDVDVSLEDDLVSRRHALVRRDWTGTHLEDLDSRNGVRVNRRKVREHTLKDRDEIEIGSARLLYVNPSESAENESADPDPSMSVQLGEPPEASGPLNASDPQDEPADEAQMVSEPSAPGPDGAAGDGEENADLGDQAGEPEGPEALAAELSGLALDPPPLEDDERPPETRVGINTRIRERFGIDLARLLPLIVVLSMAVISLIVLAITFFVL